jgi:nucleoid-associated protein YgaU
LPLLVLAIALLGAVAGFGLGSWWFADGTSSAVPIPAEIHPVVTSPALPPRAATAPEFEDVELGVPLVQIPAPPPPRRPTSPTADEFEHVVQSGETLSLIAARYGVSVEEIAAANNIADVSVISVGQVLAIPGSR